VCGRIDVLVNNAGVAPLERVNVLKTSPGSYDRLMAVNARGPFFLTQNAARRMAGQKPRTDGLRPSIVFITSVSGRRVLDRAGGILRLEGGPEHGRDGLRRRPRRQGHRGLRGPTRHHRHGYDGRVKDKYDRLIAGGLVPQGRWGLPEDVGRAVAALVRGLLLLDGAVIEVSGGMNIRRL